MWNAFGTFFLGGYNILLSGFKIVFEARIILMWDGIYLKNKLSKRVRPFCRSSQNHQNICKNLEQGRQTVYSNLEIISHVKFISKNVIMQKKCP